MKKYINKAIFLRSIIKSKKVTKKKIIIESDDWGFERIPSKKVRNNLIKKGFDLYSNPYSIYDTLESHEDLFDLRNVLNYFLNKYNKKIIITSNFILSNPDYDLIRESSFTKYYHKSFVDTYLEKYNSNETWELIQDLINSGFFYPQFHSRDHINFNYWISNLTNGLLMDAFNENVCCLNPSSNNFNVLSAYNYNNEKEKKHILSAIDDGLKIFNELFGFASISAVPPRHFYNDVIENQLKLNGVSFLQASIKKSFVQSNKTNYQFLYTGKENLNTGMKYSVRNVYFEPSYSKTFSSISKFVKRIEFLFRLNIPVIISMHRINFVGGLVKENRVKNLIVFKKLIEEIILKHPDVEFVTAKEII